MDLFSATPTGARQRPGCAPPVDRARLLCSSVGLARTGVALPAAHGEGVVAGPVAIICRGRYRGRRHSRAGRRLRAPRNGIQRPAPRPLRRRQLAPGLQLAPRLLPGFAPRVVVVVEQTVEPLLHPAPQVAQPRQSCTGIGPSAPSGARSGSRHPIHQLAPGCHQATEAVLQRIGCTAAGAGAVVVAEPIHAATLPAPFLQPALTQQTHEGNPHAAELQCPKKGGHRSGWLARP